MSKVAPKKYGDKLEMNVTGQVSIGDAIEEGRNRVARMRGGESTPDLPGHPTVNRQRARSHQRPWATPSALRFRITILGRL